MRQAGGMDQIARASPADSWIDLIFSARAAQGGVVRRSVAWVDREIGRDSFSPKCVRAGFTCWRRETSSW